MLNGYKPASPFGSIAQNSRQYGGNANPNGNGWGQAFMQQYGKPPGQMRDQWDAFRQQNGFGGGQPAPTNGGITGGGIADPTAPGTVTSGPIAAPTVSPMQSPNMMQTWAQSHPQMGAFTGQPQDYQSMIRAWLAKRPMGLLGG